MKNIKFSRLFAALMVAACLVFVGCKPEPEDPGMFIPDGVRTLAETDAIVGTWVSTYGEKFEITPTEFKNSYGTSEGYKGNNVYYAEVTEDSGYIYFQYTKAYCAEHSDTANYIYTYDEDAPDVGKWYAIYYSDLTASSVKISAAGGEKSSCETLKEVVETFTVANNYMSTSAANRYSTCTKE